MIIISLWGVISMKSKEKIKYIADKYFSELEKGTYGDSGDLFLTTRELAKISGISLEYGNKVMSILSGKGIIRLVGKHYYITKGQINPNSPLNKKIVHKNTFGMIVSDLQNVFVASLITEVSNIAENNGFSIIIRFSENIENVLEDFFTSGVQGIFVDPFVAKNYSDRFKYYPLPIVSLGFDITGIGRDSIVVDNYRAGKTVADHFIEIGCKKFSYFGFERDNKKDERLNGFIDELKALGYAVQENIIFLLPKDAKGKYSVKQLKEFVNKLIWKTSSYDKIGIFCYHDLLAYDVISIVENFEFLDKKRKIPNDFSVVGFDNLSIASIIKPSLTTVSYPINEIATKGIEAILKCIRDTDYKHKKYQVLFSLVIRSTTENKV